MYRILSLMNDFASSTQEIGPQLELKSPAYAEYVDYGKGRRRRAETMADGPDVRIVRQTIARLTMAELEAAHSPTLEAMITNEDLM